MKPILKILKEVSKKDTEEEVLLERLERLMKTGIVKRADPRAKLGVLRQTSNAGNAKQ